MTQLYDLTTEKGSYWFGYLLMRASLPKKYRLACTVPAKDKGHLHNLIRDLGKIALPKERQQHRCYHYVNNKHLITIYREAGWDDFRDKDFVNFNPKQLQHFLRGVWDARGIICETNNILRVGIRGDKDVVVWLSQKLVQVLDVNENKPGRRGDSYYVWWRGGQAIRIVRYLYCNSTRYLDRKARLAYKHIVSPQCANIGQRRNKSCKGKTHAEFLPSVQNANAPQDTKKNTIPQPASTVA